MSKRPLAAFFYSQGFRAQNSTRRWAFLDLIVNATRYNRYLNTCTSKLATTTDTWKNPDALGCPVPAGAGEEKSK